MIWPFLTDFALKTSSAASLVQDVVIGQSGGKMYSSRGHKFLPADKSFLSRENMNNVVCPVYWRLAGGEHKVAPIVHVIRGLDCAPWWVLPRASIYIFTYYVVIRRRSVVSCACWLTVEGSIRGAASFFVVVSMLFIFWYSLSRFFDERWFFVRRRWERRLSDYGAVASPRCPTLIQGTNQPNR